jgi:hypothetical protein
MDTWKVKPWMGIVSWILIPLVLVTGASYGGSTVDVFAIESIQFVPKNIKTSIEKHWALFLELLVSWLYVVRGEQGMSSTTYAYGSNI